MAVAADAPGSDRGWLELYAAACQERRQARLGPLRAKWQKQQIVFTKHYAWAARTTPTPKASPTPRPSGTSRPAPALCLLELDGRAGRCARCWTIPRRDPRPRRLLRRPPRALRLEEIATEDDYHLYETGRSPAGDVRQLTFGLGFADYEGVYLPNGDIVFNSTRCVQTVDCWWTEVSNLYTCDNDGRYLRRLGFDQVHTNYPTVTRRRPRDLHPLGIQRPRADLLRRGCSR